MFAEETPMRCRRFFLFSSVVLILMASSAVGFEDPNKPGQAPSASPGTSSVGSSLGFDTAPSARPENPSARADHCVPPAYFFSMPTYKYHATHVRRAVQSYGFDPGFPADSLSPYSYSPTGASIGWGNAGTPFGHLQYPGYGYPFASPWAFGF